MDLASIMGGILGGIGIGSIVQNYLNHLLNRKSDIAKRLYQEKREAYLGALDALHLAAVSPSDKNSKNFALWQTRIQLFGNENVAEAVQGIIDTNGGPIDRRTEFFQNMIVEMKRDLGAT